jgi:PD-(D/E)XK nuclease superfamily
MFTEATNIQGKIEAADCANFLQSIKPLALKYEENLKKQRDFKTGFNVFELISDHYYRETFHSDILRAFLNPCGKHGEREKYLLLFLEFLNSQHGAKITLSDYSKAKVTREEGKIDILITGCKHAIIIENKINDASDTPEQLYRYLDKVEKKHYEGDEIKCDAIIYLRLHGDTKPDMTGWKQEKSEKERVETKLKVICAYDGTDGGSQKDLLGGWIKKCEQQSKANSEAQHILRQYGRIIEKLGREYMNNPVMKEFYEKIINDDNYKIASLLRTMLDSLANYRAQRIVSIFENDPAPFKHVMPYKNGALFRAGSDQAKTRFEMSIWAEPKSYLFHFQDMNDKSGNTTKAMLEKMECLEKYDLIENQIYRFKKQFAFPYEEGALIKYIEEFKSELQKVLQC